MIVLPYIMHKLINKEMRVMMKEEKEDAEIFWGKY
jgi:hypothetical protein